MRMVDVESVNKDIYHQKLRNISFHCLIEKGYRYLRMEVEHENAL